MLGPLLRAARALGQRSKLLEARRQQLAQSLAAAAALRPGRCSLPGPAAALELQPAAPLAGARPLSQRGCGALAPRCASEEQRGQARELAARRVKKRPRTVFVQLVRLNGSTAKKCGTLSLDWLGSR